MNGDDPRFSRSGQSNPFGKCTEEVKSLVDEQTKEALSALAFSAGVPLSEYLRSILISHVHGHAALLRIAARPFNGTAITGQESGG